MWFPKPKVTNEQHNGRRRSPKFMELGKYTKAYKPNPEQEVIPAFPPVEHPESDPIFTLMGLPKKEQRPSSPSSRAIPLRERIRRRKARGQ